MLDLDVSSDRKKDEHYSSVPAETDLKWTG